MACCRSRPVGTSTRTTDRLPVRCTGGARGARTAARGARRRARGDRVGRLRRARRGRGRDRQDGARPRVRRARSAPRARRLEPVRRPRRAAAARRGARPRRSRRRRRSGRRCARAGGPSCSRRSGRSWRACRGTVWIVEDVHWADGASLDVLTFLGRRIEELAALIVLTFRDDELSAEHPLQRVLGALAPAAVRRVHVPPLSREAVAALAGAPADELYDATGGNAFFVTEAIAAGGELPPPSVRDAVLARAGQARGGRADDARARRGRAGRGRAVARARGRRGGRARRVRGARAARRRGRRRPLPARARPARDRGVALRWRGAPSCTGASSTRSSAGTSIRRGSSTTPSRPATRRGPSSSRCAPLAPRRSRAHTPRPPRTTPACSTIPSCSTRDARAEVLEALRRRELCGRPRRSCARSLSRGRRRCDGRRAMRARLADDLRVLSRLLWWASGDGAAAAQAGDEAVELLEPLGAELRPGARVRQPRPAAHAGAARRGGGGGRRARDRAGPRARRRRRARARADDRRLRARLCAGAGVEAGDALLADAIRLGIAIGADEQVCRAAVNLAWTARRLATARPGRGRLCDRARPRRRAREPGVPALLARDPRATARRARPVGRRRRRRRGGAGAGRGPGRRADARRSPASGSSRAVADRRARTACSRRQPTWPGRPASSSACGPSPARSPSWPGCAATARRSTR